MIGRLGWGVSTDPFTGGDIAAPNVGITRDKSVLQGHKKFEDTGHFDRPGMGRCNCKSYSPPYCIGNSSNFVLWDGTRE